MEKGNSEAAMQVPQVVRVGKYEVNSVVELEFDQDYNLVKGDELEVRDGNIVLYENLRGFVPLGEKQHLLRLANGNWVLLSIKESKNKQVLLKKVNLKYGKHCLLFDERGKMHLAQMSPHYRNIDIS